MALDDARRLEEYCEWDATDLVYAACDDFVSIAYVVGGEEDYEFVFARDSGKLVHGAAHVYDNECGGLSYYAGERPSLTNCTTCEYCGSIGAAGSGSEGPDSVGRCDFDEDGRALTPVPCPCSEEACVVEPADFCPMDLPFDCPVTLDEARQADELCNADLILYGECSDGTAFVLGSGFENSTTFGFALDSGELVFGEATRWIDSDYCAGPPVGTTTTERTLDVSLCTTCQLYDFCNGVPTGEAGSGSGSDACIVDEQGRVALPE